MNSLQPTTPSARPNHKKPSNNAARVTLRLSARQHALLQQWREMTGKRPDDVTREALDTYLDSIEPKIIAYDRKLQDLKQAAAREVLAQTNGEQIP